MAFAGSTDADLLALEAEIDRLHAAAARIYENRVEPLTETQDALIGKWMRAGRVKGSATWRAWTAWENESGFAAAIDEQDALCAQADRLIECMWSTPATRATGKAAKVRVLFNHIMSADWDGEDLDWDIGLARRLFLDLAGMAEADLGGVL